MRFRACALFALVFVACGAFAITATRKDPSSIEDFEFDWSKGPATVSACAWTVPAGLTKISEGATATKCLARISGGADGKTYVLQNRATFTGGQVLAKSIRIDVGVE